MTALVKPCVAEGPAAWTVAAKLVGRWFSDRDRVDRLLEGLPASFTGVERARCQYLVLGVVRHAGRLEAAMDRLVAHPPRFITRAVIFVAGFELIEAGSGGRGQVDDIAVALARSGVGGPRDSNIIDLTPSRDGRVPKIVHHAVDQARGLASPAEARLVNAVLRRLAADLQSQVAPPKLAPAEVLAEYYSHPAWLVRRWLVQHGAEATRALLEWNQTPAPVYARVRGGGGAPFLTPTPWPGFFGVKPGHWPEVGALLKEGRIYLQDPVTRLAVDRLDPRPGESVLDVCAAPGGKSLMIADRLGGSDDSAGSLLVAMDLPGERIARLRENLATITGVTVALVEGDASRGAVELLKERNLPTAYAAVLADVPCSNTGVMRHRADVKWRLQEGDFPRHARQQVGLLAACARLVAPGGRLVYSTCSVDPEENEGVVAAFLKGAGGRFVLEAQDLSYPWVTGHDGAGVFLLRRNTLRAPGPPL